MGKALDFLLQHDSHFRQPRLSSLYSDFTRLRNTNPDGYAANIEAWISGLSKAASAHLLPDDPNSGFILKTGPELMSTLESEEWGQPAALNAVIKEALHRGVLLPVAALRNPGTASCETERSTSAWELFSWALNRLGLVGRGHKVPDETRYVLVRNLQAAAQRLFQSCCQRNSRMDRLIPMTEFAKIASQALSLRHAISQDDLYMLLDYLSREKRQVAFDESLVKILDEDRKCQALNKLDKDIASVKSLIFNLNSQISDIAGKIDDLTKRTKSAMDHNDRNAALRLLKARKVQEKVLNQRSSVVIQLEDLYAKIDEAATQVDVIHALKEGTEALRHYHRQLGGAQTVDAILDDLNTAMADSGDVAAMIQHSAKEGQILDDSEIDAELETLIAEESRARQTVAEGGIAAKVSSIDADASGSSQHFGGEDPSIQSESTNTPVPSSSKLERDERLAHPDNAVLLPA